MILEFDPDRPPVRKPIIRQRKSKDSPALRRVIEVMRVLEAKRPIPFGIIARMAEGYFEGGS